MGLSVLIIKTPECCGECKYRYVHNENYCSEKTYNKQVPGSFEEIEVNRIIPIGYTEGTCRPDWCPLRELPQRETINSHDDYFDGVKVGFNNCLNAITGGEIDGEINAVE